MPWGNYRKTPCEQCGTSYWAAAGAASSGARNLCRSCARGQSSAGPTLATATGGTALEPVVGRTSLRDHMAQAQRLQVLQRVVPSLPSHLRDLQFRELTPEDYEVLQQLDEVNARSNGPAVMGLFDSSGADLAAINRWQPSSNGQWRPQRTAMRPNALLPAPESGDWKGEDCAICLECLKDTETVCALPRCGHVFHKTCIECWLTRGKPSCPLDAIEVDC